MCLSFDPIAPLVLYSFQSKSLVEHKCHSPSCFLQFLVVSGVILFPCIMFSISFLVSACLLFICLSVISCFTLKVYFLMCGVVLCTSCFCCFPFFVIVCSPFISFICALFTSPAPCPYQCLILQLTPEDKIVKPLYDFLGGSKFSQVLFLVEQGIFITPAPIYTSTSFL